MPPKKKVIGYDQQTGQPIYDENLPSPMENDPLEPLPDVASPPLDDFGTMNGVSADPYAETGYVPQEVANDVATMDIPTTGMSFDFNSLNVQTREDFDALPVEQQELLKAMKRGVRFDPKTAAEFILNQSKMRMETDQKIKMRQGDPVVQKSVEKTDQEIEEKKKLAEQKRQAVLDEIGSMRSTISGLLTHPGFSGSVGMKNAAYGFGIPFIGSSTDPYAGTPEADFKAMLEQVQGSAFLQAFERLKGGGQITQIEGEKATQAIIRAQQSQSEEGFRKSMQEALELLNRAEKRAMSGEIVQQTSTPAATAAAQRPTKTVSGIVWEKGEDGKWYRKR